MCLTGCLTDAGLCQFCWLRLDVLTLAALCRFRQLKGIYSCEDTRNAVYSFQCTPVFEKMLRLVPHGVGCGRVQNLLQDLLKCKLSACRLSNSEEAELTSHARNNTQGTPVLQPQLIWERMMVPGAICPTFDLQIFLTRNFVMFSKLLIVQSVAVPLFFFMILFGLLKTLPRLLMVCFWVDVVRFPCTADVHTAVHRQPLVVYPLVHCDQTTSWRTLDRCLYGWHVTRHTEVRDRLVQLRRDEVSQRSAGHHAVRQSRIAAPLDNQEQNTGRNLLRPL